MANQDIMRDLLDPLCDEDDALLQFMDFLFEDLIEEDLDGASKSSSRLNIGINPNAWQTLEDPLFSDYFRMNRSTFMKLVAAVGNHLSQATPTPKIKTPLDLSVMMGLWILANADTFRSTAAHFGVSKGVVFFHYVRLIGVLSELTKDYIVWPSACERVNIREEFESLGYPGCVGAIGCTHIYVTAPLQQSRRYVNRHHTYSIMAQTVCDHRKLYRDIYVGQPGSVGDHRTFQRSPLSRNLFQPEVLRADEHLIGDQGYTLTDKVLIPYPYETQDEKQKHNNKCLSSSRSVVEQSYELLKEKFPRLRRFRSYSITIAIKHITSCFVLHNFIILEGRKLRAECIVGEDANVLVTENMMEESKNRGAIKREYICQLLWNTL